MDCRSASSDQTGSDLHIPHFRSFRFSHWTTFTNAVDAAGCRVKSTAYAGASTRVEAYNRDGSLDSLTGTAVFPVRYEYGADANGTFKKTTSSMSMTRRRLCST
jgi:hypothetical protein